LVIIYEANSGLRQFSWTAVCRVDVVPWWYGYSVGRWEGDTLVMRQ
jgi:hypothetical protein